MSVHPLPDEEPALLADSSASAVVVFKNPGGEEDDEEPPPSTYYEDRACFCLSKDNCLRSGIIKMYEHPKFDQTVLTVIGLNCITLAMYDPTDPDCVTTRCKILTWCDIIFSSFFMLEMFIKMFAMGVFGPGAYFSTAWNKFDCFIVATSIVDFVGIQLTYLKVFRALRPLRAVNKFPKLKILVKLLLDTIPMMASVGLLCFFIFSVYGILAIQLWTGLTHQRCYRQQLNTDGRFSYFAFDDDENGGFICTNTDELGQGGYNSCNSAIDDDGNRYPFCLRRADMGLGYDPVPTGEASNPFFGAISYDNIWSCWIVIFQIITMEGWVDQMYLVQGGYSFFAGAFYFCSLIVIGAFFSINLALVVIATQFGASKDEAADEIRRDEASEKRKAVKAKELAIANGETGISCWDYFTGCHCLKSTAHEKLQKVEDRLLALRQDIEKGKEGDPGHKDAVEALSMMQTLICTKKSGKIGRKACSFGVEECLQIKEFELEARRSGSSCVINLYKLRVFCECPPFENFIMACISINVFCFATEYDGMTDPHKDILSYLNYFFCGVFAIEMVLKIIGFGPAGYFSSGFNVFDFSLVTISAVEIGMGGASSLSFLRMFRLVRLFRLVRFLPGLQFQLLVMLQTLGSVFSFLLLLALFIFIYGVLGMFLFGNNLTFEGQTDRKNFDTLFWALVTIFQVLTLEDWNAAMYAGVRYGGQWAAVYYISLIVLGNYIMFNLFVAILIDGFGGEELEEEVDSDDELDDQPAANASRRPTLSVNEAKDVLGNIARLHVVKRVSARSSRVASRRGSVRRGSSSRRPIEEAALMNMNPEDRALMRERFEAQDAKMQANSSAVEPLQSISVHSSKPSSRRGSVDGGVPAAPLEERRSSTVPSPTPPPEGKGPLTLLPPPPPPPPVLDPPHAPTPSPPPTTGASSRGFGTGFGTGVHSETSSSFFSFGSGNGIPSDEAAADAGSGVEMAENASAPAAPAVVPSPDAAAPDAEDDHSAVKYLKEDSPAKDQSSAAANNTAAANNSAEAPQGTAVGVTPDAPPTEVVTEEPAPAEEAAASEDAPAEGEEAQMIWKERCFPGLYHRNHAMFCFSTENKFRILCTRIMLHPVFDQIVIFLIILNSTFMGMESPDYADDSIMRKILTWANDCFCFIFLIELLIKWVAMGVYITPNCYFDDGWNRLDGFIVSVSCVDFVMTQIGVAGGMLNLLKICRMFRALRPLRAINKLPNLKRVVDTLIMALEPIGTTLIIIFAFFFIFGILGTQMFMGQFYFCDLADGSGACESPRDGCMVSTKAQCLALSDPTMAASDSNVPVGTWRNQEYNFDHLGRAFMTLFVLASIDGWVEIMYNGVDCAGIDMQPVKNERWYLAIYFVIFLLVGGFFIINMFVGVIVDNFQKNGKKPDPTPEEEAEMAEIKAAEDYAILHENDFLVEYSETRLKMHAFALGQPFEIFIALIIIMNVLTMAMEHYNMSDNFQMFLRITNYIFTAIFVFEMFAKQAALGLTRYHTGLQKAWNNFDVFIVFISVLGILIDDVIGPDNVPIDPSMLKVLRILRVARILKLLKNAKDLMVLLTVVARSLAQVGNLATLLFLLFFIYAALGIELFGRICTDDTLFECDSIGPYAHFRNFGMTMLLLFRLSTGDNWNGILKDAMLEAPDCDDTGDECIKNCCANTAIAPLYFISFCLVSTFVMLNLVIAVLMAELESAEDEAVDFEDEFEEEENVLAAKEEEKQDEGKGPPAAKQDKDGEAPGAIVLDGQALASKKEDPVHKESDNKGESEEETTETLERQVREALQPESASDAEVEKSAQAKKQIETLEAELAAALAQQEDRSESPTSAPALPPLPLHSPPKVSSNPTTPGRPSSFVPFAPALVVDDDQEQEESHGCQQPGSAGR